jgi:hypothetical protein
MDMARGLLTMCGIAKNNATGISHIIRSSNVNGGLVIVCTILSLFSTVAFSVFFSVSVRGVLKSVDAAKFANCIKKARLLTSPRVHRSLIVQ